MLALAAILGAAVLAGCGEKKEAEASAEEPGGRADVAAPAPGTPEVAGAEAAPPSGEALLNARCTVCHNLDRVHKRKDTRDGWEKIVGEMIKKGAVLDDAEREAAVDHLAATYGK
jgi:cytochrome c5